MHTYASTHTVAPTQRQWRYRTAQGFRKNDAGGQGACCNGLGPFDVPGSYKHTWHLVDVAGNRLRGVGE